MYLNRNLGSYLSLMYLLCAAVHLFEMVATLSLILLSNMNNISASVINYNSTLIVFRTAP